MAGSARITRTTWCGTFSASVSSIVPLPDSGSLSGSRRLWLKVGGILLFANEFKISLFNSMLRGDCVELRFPLPNYAVFTVL